MPVDQFSYRLNPYRANYNALYPTGESRWESFALDRVDDFDHVVGCMGNDPDLLHLLVPSLDADGELEGEIRPAFRAGWLKAWRV
jgi:hypothetical protein